MAEAFKTKPLVQQQPDKVTIRIFDDSNYTTNTDGITSVLVTSRSLKLTNSAGTVEATLPMVLQDDDDIFYVDYTITKDRYFKYELTLGFASISDKVGYITNVTTGFYDAVFLSIMEKNGPDCGCNVSGICSEVGWAQHSLAAAIKFGSREMGLLAQRNIDTAYQFINSVPNC